MKTVTREQLHFNAKPKGSNCLFSSEQLLSFDFPYQRLGRPIELVLQTVCHQMTTCSTQRVMSACAVCGRLMLAGRHRSQYVHNLWLAR